MQDVLDDGGAPRSPRSISISLLAACGGGSKSTAEKGPSRTTTTGAKGTAAAPSELGQGVTADTIKVGVAAPNFDCFKDFVDEIRVDEDKVWQAYFDAINDQGGINGRKIEMDFKKQCPINNADALTACTEYTDDDHVFALLGTFVDFTGDAQECMTAKHKTILITFLLNQAFIDRAPPALLLAPDITKERRVNVILELLKRKKTLKGKKIAILGETVTKDAVETTIAPGLKALGEDLGTTAILEISGTDTSAAQAQLDSFIEKWKSEGTNALFISGEQVAHKQFVQKIREAMPDIVLIADNSGVINYGQEFTVEKVTPNPYEGIISAEGDTGAEHIKLDVWKYCAGIYEKAFGKPAPIPGEIVPGPNGKNLDVYNLIEDACTLTTMFADIAKKAGPNLNNTTWTEAVDNYGKIRDMQTRFASLHKGKYDADDTFGLVAFDSSIGPEGDWSKITPVEDVGSG